MNIKELKKILESLPDDMEVILSKDPEGNGYSPLAGGDSNIVYIPDTSYSGSIYSLDFTAEDVCMDKNEWETIKSKPRSLVLFPIN